MNECTGQLSNEGEVHLHGVDNFSFLVSDAQELRNLVAGLNEMEQGANYRFQGQTAALDKLCGDQDCASIPKIGES